MKDLNTSIVFKANSEGNITHLEIKGAGGSIAAGLLTIIKTIVDADGDTTIEDYLTTMLNTYLEFDELESRLKEK